MWRTVIVNQGEKIKTEQNWLVVVSDSGESKIPIEDIYTVVIDNQNAMIDQPVRHQRADLIGGTYLLLQ